MNAGRAAESGYEAGEAQDLLLPESEGNAWRIHTGPFPLIVVGRREQLWLWRMTNDDHFTAIVVRLTEDVLLPEGQLAASVADAVTSRGQSAVQACLGWKEPPREITFGDPVGRPVYWGGRP